MPDIHIVTDSSVRFLDPATAEHPLISLAPVRISFPSHSYIDDPQLDMQATRQAFRDQPGLASSMPPSTGELKDIYAQLQSQTTQILSIHTSSALSSASQHARQASEGFRGRCDIQVLDSRTASVGLGLLVAAAAQAAAAGAGLEDVVRVVRGMISRLYMVLFLEELAYLQKHGLISRSQSILGGMLGIIPFLTMENGRLIPMEKVRTRPRALEKLIEFVSEFAEIERLAILQPGRPNDEEAALVAERLQALYPHTPIRFIDYGPSLATHVGADALGVVVLETAEEAL